MQVPESTLSENTLIQSAPLNLVKHRPIHFIGVGGVGMSGLAKLLLLKGFKVSGSDSQSSSYTEMLEKLSGRIFIGHQADHVPYDGIIVATTAISDSNPEMMRAKELNLAIYHRSDMLREILKLHDTIVGVTGTHGKTTVTGMVGTMMERAGLDPTIIAGGKIPGLNTNAKAGQDDAYAVAELDESDGTVVQYAPHIAIITNLELDHPEHFQDGVESLLKTFRTFLGNLSAEHRVIFNLDCPLSSRLYEEFSGKIKAIGFYPDSQPSQVDSRTYYFKSAGAIDGGAFCGELWRGDQLLGTLEMGVPGRHNLSNGATAAIVGNQLGVQFETIAEALRDFQGMGRRFEKLGQYNGAFLVDDYAHHPTEVLATLKAARDFCPKSGRVVAMFQPHRYQRFQTFWEEFLQAFGDADEVIVVDVYSAGGQAIDGITAERFVQEMQARNIHSKCDYWASGDWNGVVSQLKTVLKPQDLFITLGAGDVTNVGRILAAS